MTRGRRHSVQQIVLLLSAIEKKVLEGKNLSLSCSEAGVSEHTYYRWRAEFGSHLSEQVPPAFGEERNQKK